MSADNAGVGRCAAAHVEDPGACDGPAAAVRIVDQLGEETTGCPRHAAVLLATLDQGRVYPGPDDQGGDAIEVFRRSKILPGRAYGDDYDRAMFLAITKDIR